MRRYRATYLARGCLHVMLRALGLLVVWGALANAAPPPPPPSTAAVIQLAVTSDRTCALHADGNVSCWGANTNQELALDPDAKPAPIGMPIFHDVVQLEGACARYRDGSVKCLGLGDSNQLEVQPLVDVVALGRSCARTSNGQVFCFDHIHKTWPRIEGVDDAISADGNAIVGCVVRKAGTVSCWGLPDAVLVPGAVLGPVEPVAGVKNAVQVRAGMFSACARLRDGGVSCWGNNMDGQLGRGTFDAESRTNRAAPSLVRDAVDLIVNGPSACVRRTTGGMACWGRLSWLSRPIARPQDIKGLPAVTAFAAGEATCAVGSARDVWCWGGDRSGQVGIGLGGVLTTARVIPNLHDIVEIDPSTGTCALRATGAVVCWSSPPIPLSTTRKYQHVSGYNGYMLGIDLEGQLWVGDEPKPRPTPKATQQAGPCVLANGEVWCSANQMGARSNPVTGRVPGFDDAIELVGSGTQCIRHRTGTVTCFSNWSTSPINHDNPEDVVGISDAIAVATNGGMACAVRADHTVWCWGDRNSNLLGHVSGAPEDPVRTAPPRSIGVSDAIALALAEGPNRDRDAACIVKVDGTVACWGHNDGGRLGAPESKLSSTTPLVVRGVTDATQVVLGRRHGCALQRAGTVTCWGTTNNGESGTIATSSIEHPVQVVWP